jgi:hypothetical protein
VVFFDNPLAEAIFFVKNSQSQSYGLLGLIFVKWISTRINRSNHTGALPSRSKRYRKNSLFPSMDFKNSFLLDISTSFKEHFHLIFILVDWQFGSQGMITFLRGSQKAFLDAKEVAIVIHRARWN